MSKDYMFHVIWEDRHKQLYKVGILAQIDEVFYVVLKSEENAKLAYENGFCGIPGFKNEEVYVSMNKLFDFFERRTLESNPRKQCEELSKTGGKSMVDSFSVEEISEKLSAKYKKIILEAYELQKRKNEISEEKKKNDSDELTDIK